MDYLHDAISTDLTTLLTRLALNDCQTVQEANQYVKNASKYLGSKVITRVRSMTFLLKQENIKGNARFWLNKMTVAGMLKLCVRTTKAGEEVFYHKVVGEGWDYAHQDYYNIVFEEGTFLRLIEVLSY